MLREIKSEKRKAFEMTEPGQMNIDAQKASFHNFVKLFTFGTMGVVVLLVLMAIFLL
jgi:flagellar biogenesis protein FliO